MPWLETNLTDDSRRILNTFVTIKGTILTILTNYTITKFIPITSSMSRVVLVGIVPVIPIRPVSPSIRPVSPSLACNTSTKATSSSIIVITTSAIIVSIPVDILTPITITTSIDLHDVDGDKEFGIETLSVKLGKERVFWLCVYMLSIAYGAAVVVGASSSILLSKLLTIISHCILASSLWLRARTVDLSSNTSTFSFYMFIWKASDATYILNQIPHASSII
ncbi:hypothetical protein CICLE_v10010573mg [Citrus x clementina]|uniref:Uncharacterized protein n=1 Tax=Citrus clementina TaxID=85681 RepID=V4UH65_CITCL|nr:hypothetical protein CICLE_v10010573mg [Citrus x clementina]